MEIRLYNEKGVKTMVDKAVLKRLENEEFTEKEKAVIVLYYFEDLSIKEIASILQMPVGTVKYHLSYGRNHLRNFLQ